jgi:ribosomal protein S17
MNNGASFVGRVVSNRMQKTVVVAVDRLVWVPKLKVFERRTSRHLAHCDAADGAPPASLAAAATTTATATATTKTATETAAKTAGTAAKTAAAAAAAAASEPPQPLHVGDVVRIGWCPRVSRRKSYRVERVLRRARVYSASLGEQYLGEHRARRQQEEEEGLAAARSGGSVAPPRVARAEAALAVARARLAALVGASGASAGGAAAASSSA